MIIIPKNISSVYVSGRCLKIKLRSLIMAYPPQLILPSSGKPSFLTVDIGMQKRLYEDFVGLADDHSQLAAVQLANSRDSKLLALDPPVRVIVSALFSYSLDMSFKYLFQLWPLTLEPERETRGPIRILRQFRASKASNHRSQRATEHRKKYVPSLSEAVPSNPPKSHRPKRLKPAIRVKQEPMRVVTHRKDVETYRYTQRFSKVNAVTTWYTAPLAGPPRFKGQLVNEGDLYLHIIYISDMDGPPRRLAWLYEDKEWRDITKASEVDYAVRCPFAPARGLVIKLSGKDLHLVPSGWKHHKAPAAGTS
ncbi:hypothetical protein FPV67DRAFT_1449064 [Lyophyllum atratum]|nr:hypothetical protein FPV67DRAFT_1449064 [Lyophyllum atratum]